MAARPKWDRRAGVVPLCVWLGRSLGFVPAPWGRGYRGEGARPAGQAPGVSSGCRRGDNRGRGPSFASLLSLAGSAPLGSPLSEGAGRRLQRAAALASDCGQLGTLPFPSVAFAQ